MRKSLIIALTIALMAMFSLANIAAAGEINRELTKNSTIDRVMRSGKLRVGLSSFVPWAMQDKKGEWIGFEIDVAKQLAKDMGVELVLVPTKWEGLIPSLLTGKFDMIIAGMCGTPKRAMKINFTIPYDYSGMDLVLNKKFAEGITHWRQLDVEGNVILARVGTTGAALGKKLFKKAKMRLFPDEGPMVQELLSANATALLSSAPAPATFAAKYPDTLIYLESHLTMQPISIGVPKGDPDTLAYLNNWITYVRNNGFIEEKVNYWWKGLEWEELLK